MKYEKPHPISMERKPMDIGSALHGSVGKGKVFI
jgi:hypothetical protein